MDKSDAREILNGGQTNDLRKSGSLITDPSVVIELFFEGDAFHTVFGNFGLDEGELDYAVHRARDVTRGEVDDFYSLNLVEADVYTMKDGEVSVQRYEATPVGWEETER